MLVHRLITNARTSIDAFHVTTFPSGKDVLCQSRQSKREITRWRMHWSRLDDIWEEKKRRNRFYNNHASRIVNLKRQLLLREIVRHGESVPSYILHDIFARWISFFPRHIFAFLNYFRFTINVNFLLIRNFMNNCATEIRVSIYIIYLFSVRNIYYYI